MPDGSNLVLQLPRIGAPESAMLPGMAVPAPREPLQAPPSPGSMMMPDTSQAVPTALQEPPTWVYDIDPANGRMRATYYDEVFIGPNQVATKADIAAATTGVSSWNTRTGAVVLTLADITSAGGAPSNNPTFVGVPNAATAAPGTNSTQLATCQFVQAALSLAAGVSTWQGRSGAVTMTLADVTGVGGAPAASPVLTGIPTAPTAPGGTNSQQLATTAFVGNALAGAVVSWNGRTGSVSLTLTDVTGVGGAPINGPAFTGNPTAVTQVPGTANTTLATTAYVMNAVTSAVTGVTSFNSRTGAITLQTADITGAGGAPLASPALTGTPTAPTATAGTNSQQLATTAFVANALGAASLVNSFNSRTGAITLTTADVTGAGGAPQASPALTGIPTVPTAAPGTNTVQAASTAFVQAAIGGAVVSFNSRTGPVTLNSADITGAGGALLAGPAFTGVPTAPTAGIGVATTQLATTAFVTNSPAFAGNPTAPTQPSTDNSTKLATTAYVQTAVTPAVYNNTGRNLLHNPMFTVQQRGQGAWTSPSLTADRWHLYFSTDTNNATLPTLTDVDRAAIGDEAATSCFRTLVNGNATAGAYTSFAQSIEGVRRLAGKTVTVSFWAQSASGNPSIGVSWDQNFGSGGSPSATVNGNGQAVIIGTGWQRYSVSFAIPSAAAKTPGTNGDDLTSIDFWLSASTTFAARAAIGVQSNTFSIWGVQCEVGSVLTPLAKRDPADELMFCQRFYQTGAASASIGYSAGGWTQQMPLSFAPAMRATPSMALVSVASYANGSAGAVGAMNNQTYTVNWQATATGGTAIAGAIWTASADL